MPKKRQDSVGRTLLRPPTSSCQVDTVPSIAAVTKRCPPESNLTDATEGMTYGGGMLAAGNTP